MQDSRPPTYGQAASQTGASASQPYADVLLNRYRIINARGTGGFGTVLTCWDTRLQRRVAIKRLPLASAGGSSTLGEALAEARTSSMLSHPNIVTVFDFEVEGSYAYLVMEFVDGLTLAELLSRVEGGTLTHDEAACLVQSVASALAYAHENGVLHMDIKPTNIMIDRSGQVKLCDFGMATLASATGYGDARGGTVGYMPPEQIEGQLVDERCDIFSLAVVVWQSLLGSSPFAAADAQRSLALIRKGPAKPSKTDPSLAGMAEEALLGALAASPSARIPSVETLAKELVFALGDPAAGAESLRGLILQTPEDASSDPDDWEGERLPLGVAYPWLPGAFVRLLAAATTALPAWQLVPAVLGVAGGARVGVTLVCIAAAALWPPLGAAVAGLGFCAAIGLHATTAAPLLLAIVLAIAFGLWWATCATKSHLATAALLLPAYLGSPIAGTLVAGYALTPLRACATACVSWVAARLWEPAVAAGFALNGQVDALLIALFQPAQLLALAGCGASAAACAAITWWDNANAWAIGGQVVGTTLLIAIQLLAARMENGGIWADPSWANAGVAVLLGVLVCTACIMRGARDDIQESEV